MKPFVPPLLTTPPARPPVSRPEMLFAVQEGYGSPIAMSDSARFPQYEAVRARYSAKRLKPLEAFALAMSEAQNRVWILDGFLFKPDVGTADERISLLCDWMPSGFAANDVKLLTKSQAEAIDNEHATTFAEHAQWVNDRSPKRTGRLVIETKFSLERDFEYVHDRFAIVDDELWHFGAAVAGLHRQLSATTRGWDVNDCEAERFFLEAWNADLLNNRGK